MLVDDFEHEVEVQRRVEEVLVAEVGLLAEPKAAAGQHHMHFLSHPFAQAEGALHEQRVIFDFLVDLGVGRPEQGHQLSGIVSV